MALPFISVVKKNLLEYWGKFRKWGKRIIPLSKVQKGEIINDWICKLIIYSNELLIVLKFKFELEYVTKYSTQNEVLSSLFQVKIICNWMVTCLKVSKPLLNETKESFKKLLQISCRRSFEIFKYYETDYVSSVNFFTSNRQSLLSKYNLKSKKMFLVCLNFSPPNLKIFTFLFTSEWNMWTRL